MATAHNLTVDNHAVGGTTTTYWARRSDSLKKAVDENPDCKWVWLTIGGNDAIPAMEEQTPLDDIMTECTTNTQTFLDPLFEAHPDVRVVQFGYDIMGWDKNSICKNKARKIFWNCTDPTSSTEGTACANEQFYTIQTQYVEGLSQLYDNHDAINLIGSLQKAGGIEDADVAEPNDDFYSPADLIQSNCIHATDEGFAYIFSNMWDVYFSEQM